MKMTYEDIEEYRKNATNILKKEAQYETSKAVDRAFGALACVKQFKWERDIAIEQLKELGIGFGEKIDGVYLREEEYEELIKYKHICTRFE